MLSPWKPSVERVARLVDGERHEELTYDAVGATASSPPPGYVLDHTRVRLGEGDEDFRAASLAIREWEQFRTGWLEVAPRGVPVREGEVVAVVARVFGLWTLNACRIVYVVDEPGRRFGFAYGTLPSHAGSGEERFVIERDDDGAVWYDVLAFSRLRHPLARLARPLVRRFQKRFGQDSANAVRRFVTANRSTDGPAPE